MNKFSVGLLSSYTTNQNPPFNNECGTYPSDTATGGKYQLDCSSPFKPSRYVVLFCTTGDKTVNVGEFEVYGNNISKLLQIYTNVVDFLKFTVIIIIISYYLSLLLKFDSHLKNINLST